MTQQLVDALTDVKTSRDQECIGQGIANTSTGFIGGMAGCAMIGRSMINVKSGGRGRLSAFTAGAVLLILVVFPGDWVAQISIPALVAVVYTHYLVIGVLLSGIFFAAKIAQLLKMHSHLSEDGQARTYGVVGQVFYGSVEDFGNGFDFKERLARVVIDVTHAHIWDISSVQALDLVVMKLRRLGAEVSVIGMNEATETIVDRLALHDKPGALDMGVEP